MYEENALNKWKHHNDSNLLIHNLKYISKIDKNIQFKKYIRLLKTKRFYNYAVNENNAPLKIFYFDVFLCSYYKNVYFWYVYKNIYKSKMHFFKLVFLCE